MKIRNALQRLLEVGRKPHYYNFGYLPTDQWTLRDRISGKCFGKRNLVKRLQVPALLKALALKPTDTVLDYGCGGGYITVEIAKIAGRVHGVDITPELRNLPIPPKLTGRLGFHVVTSVELPFPDGYFDCILASELLGTIPAPGLFLKEIRRTLKPDGRLVVLNGAGHPGIAAAYENDSSELRRLKNKYGPRVPATYDEYCALLHKSFSNAQTRYFTAGDLQRLIEEAGLEVHDIYGIGSEWVGNQLSWHQFKTYLRTNETLRQPMFLTRFWWYSLVQQLDRRPYPGWLVCIAGKGKLSGGSSRA